MNTKGLLLLDFLDEYIFGDFSWWTPRANAKIAHTKTHPCMLLCITKIYSTQFCECAHQRWGLYSWPVNILQLETKLTFTPGPYNPSIGHYVSCSHHFHITGLELGTWFFKMNLERVTECQVWLFLDISETPNNILCNVRTAAKNSDDRSMVDKVCLKATGLVA
jgi:hypothetical protein